MIREAALHPQTLFGPQQAMKQFQRKVAEVGRMPSPGCLEFALSHAVLDGVGAQRLQHVHTRTVKVDQVAARERPQFIDIGPGHCLRRVRRAPTGEDAQLQEFPGQGCGQMVHTPVDGGL